VTPGRVSVVWSSGRASPYTRPMNADQPPLPKPAEYKIKADGRGGLIRATLVGEPHDGVELFMDEKDLPPEIYASGRAGAFEWWPAGVKDMMERTALGSDPDAPPVRYILH
jgi:hypothetical protein